jgi:hypothetical protein
MSKMQLMQAQQVSQTGVLRSLGMDFKEEQRQILDEQRFVQEEQAKMQKNMEDSALMEQMAPSVTTQFMQSQAQGDQGGGQAPAGAQPPPGPAQSAPPSGAAGMAAQGMSIATPTAPNQKITPQDLQDKANALANQMLAMPESQRQSEMTKLKSQDPVIHSLVKQTINNIRQQAQTQGARMVLQQQYGTM